MSEQTTSELIEESIERVIDKTGLDRLKLSELGDYLRHWKQVKHEAEEEKRAAELKIEAAELALYEKTTAQDLAPLTNGGYNFKPHVESYPRVNKEKEWDFNGWLYEKNYRLTIHAPSLRGWYNHHSAQY